MRKKKEPFKTQKDTKARNEHKILIALSMGAMSFTQIQNASGLTPAGLNSILKRMIKENKIYKKGIGKRTSYSISSGVTAKEMWYLGHILADMRENECKYYIDYSDDLQSELFDYGVPWGITSHLFLDKGIGKPLNPFQKVDIFEAEKYIFEKILSNVKKRKISIDIRKEGKIVLAFEIDYQRLVQEINSYNDAQHEKRVKARLQEMRS